MLDFWWTHPLAYRRSLHPEVGVVFLWEEIQWIEGNHLVVSVLHAG
jgi:hypothetical protein